MATLQSRIASMQSQLLIGGQKVEDTPQFRTLLAREQVHMACMECGAGARFYALLAIELAGCVLHQAKRLIGQALHVHGCGGQQSSHPSDYLSPLQARIREQYEARLTELEAEQRGVAEDRAQVEDAGTSGPLPCLVLGCVYAAFSCAIAFRCCCCSSTKPAKPPSFRLNATRHCC